MFEKFKTWLKTPPEETDSFGVHIREAYQSLFCTKTSDEDRFILDSKFLDLLESYLQTRVQYFETHGDSLSAKHYGKLFNDLQYVLQHHYNELSGTEPIEEPEVTVPVLTEVKDSVNLHRTCDSTQNHLVETKVVEQSKDDLVAAVETGNKAIAEVKDLLIGLIKHIEKIVPKENDEILDRAVKLQTEICGATGLPLKFSPPIEFFAAFGKYILKSENERKKLDDSAITNIETSVGHLDAKYPTEESKTIVENLKQTGASPVISYSSENDNIQEDKLSDDCIDTITKEINDKLEISSDCIKEMPPEEVIERFEKQSDLSTTIPSEVHSVPVVSESKINELNMVVDVLKNKIIKETKEPISNDELVENKLFEELCDMVRDINGNLSITRNSDIIEDLNFDSLDIEEFRMMIEEEYAILDCDNLDSINTINDVIKYIRDNSTDENIMVKVQPTEPPPSHKEIIIEEPSEEIVEEEVQDHSANTLSAKRITWEVEDKKSDLEPGEELIDDSEEPLAESKPRTIPYEVD